MNKSTNDYMNERKNGAAFLNERTSNLFNLNVCITTNRKTNQQTDTPSLKMKHLQSRTCFRMVTFIASRLIVLRSLALTRCFHAENVAHDVCQMELQWEKTAAF